MITTITPLRRIAVTLAMTGVTAFGAVAIAPAAFADEGSSVSQTGNYDQSGDAAVATPEVVVPEVVPPVAEPAPVVPPVVETPPAPAPVVTPPPVVIGKDGKPVKAPKVCTSKDLSDLAAKVAKATTQAAQLNKTAAGLRQVSVALRAQALKMNASQARVAVALANVGDLAASKLEAQAKDVVAKANTVDCIVVPVGGVRF